MANTNNQRSTLHRCNFCGKTQNQVQRLIAGPNVFICNECVDLCNMIIEEEVTKFARKRKRLRNGLMD